MDNTWLIAGLVAVTVMAIGGATVLIQNARREASAARQRATHDEATPAELEDGPRLIRTVFRLGEAMSKGQASRNLREELAAAGYHSQSAAAIYMGTKLLLGIAGLVTILVLVIPADLPIAVKIGATIFGSALMFFIPNLGVGLRRDRRRAEVRKVLPDAVDMLEICVSSGMGIDAAWTAVGDEIRRVSPTFADEMELTNLEVSLGVPRALAMRHMADRTGAEDLSSLVALLVQSERFGAGIIEALTTFAKTMRETRGQRAEEAA
ncbi:MAG TPA: type II secretion system F family protein, partial [Candidatus Limnocylindrales bacterium]|nr:type II secretion system F family protein [Candidatus Limnocylindrales bacterium]